MDRFLPRAGLPCLVYCLTVCILLAVAPHVPPRAGLAGDALAALAAGGWCALNFWRCRHAHCLITGPGWLLLGAAAAVGAIVGHSLLSGDEQPLFAAVLLVALAFEGIWRLARGTNAVGRRRHQCA